ncbi:replication protein A 70 kDa DNA-binding subunit C-like isoform X1 [Senna tora]|uniref:Replication protein A 70 kDa DNA-binding subunit C-like isoform X1 n=1 Tax=Senna tora TaxID=362788 RepID=A0A834XHC5_9FABA|nr:replication protein A 70 kDa DNA-binding subunit C-like isoform X1 [Senna tora]
MIQSIGTVLIFSPHKQSSQAMRISKYCRMKLSITLCGKYVDQLINFVSNSTGVAVVVALQYFKVKEYNGHITLCNSMYASRMLLNTEIEEIMHFRDALRLDELVSPITPVINNDGGALSPIEAAFAGWTISSTHDLQFVGDEQILCILASVLKVNPDRGKCDTVVNASTTRFKIELLILDDSGTANVTIFDKDVERFLEMSAADLRKEQFQVSVRASNWKTSSSFTVQRMTCDPSLIDRFTAYHKARVDLTGNDNIEDTPVQLKTSSRLDMDGRRLSFADSDPSPSRTSSSRGRGSWLKQLLMIPALMMSWITLGFDLRGSSLPPSVAFFKSALNSP